MKIALLAVVGALFSIAVAGTVWNSTSCAYTPKQDGAAIPAIPGERQTVLVELFTSEGCSSCPPADRQLTFMQQHQPVSGADIVTLSYHVDYWDRLGWKDRFSSAEFSERQNKYAVSKNLDSSYTPQMIVDGGAQFVGSNARTADDAVAEASKLSKGRVSMSIDAGKLKVTIDDLPDHASTELLLAVAEDKLETDVRAGENSGSKLAHTGVVRSLTRIGEIKPGEKTYGSSTLVPSNDGWNAANLRYVVFAQEKGSGRVIAVGYLPADKG